MDRDETVALFLQGREAWNAWAERMLAERRALETDGGWAAKKYSSGHLEAENAGTEGWMKAAAAVFSYCLFRVSTGEPANGAEGEEETNGAAVPAVKPVQLEADCIDFDGFIFPGEAWFEGATFPSNTSFNCACFMASARFDNAVFMESAWFVKASFSGYARFSGAKFKGNAWLDSTAFLGNAQFDSAAFSGNALFGSASFSGNAGFGCANFSGYASFGNATFSGPARFDGATFSGGAWFNRAAFLDSAGFSSAAFSGNAWFHGAAFRSSAAFDGAAFRKEATFEGIEAERRFNMTGALFARVPDFGQADFKRAPDLSAVGFPVPRLWRAGKTELIVKYRAIRRMANQGADYRREQMAFKGELRSRRWTVDRWWYVSTWLGLFYDGAADCGRSIMGPLAVWGTSVLVFALVYLNMANLSTGGWQACVASGGDPWMRALILSGRNALLLLGGGNDPRIVQVCQCLFQGTPAEPHIPDAVTIVETFVQVPLSAALIFLVLLAVRNRFKIK